MVHPASFNCSLKPRDKKKVVFFSVCQLLCLRECTDPSYERSCLKKFGRLLGQLVVLTRKDAGKTSLLSSPFDPQPNELPNFVSHSAVSQ